MAPPINDNFASAEVLSGTSGSTSGTTLDATKEVSEPTISTTFEQSVWYKITPTQTGEWTFIAPGSEMAYVGDLSESNGNLRGCIFNETADTLAECTRNNELPDGFAEDSGDPFSDGDMTIKVQLYVGNTYYLKIFSNSSSAISNDSVCSFNLYWEYVTDGPANDLLANATSFSEPLPDSITGQTNYRSAAEDNETLEWGFGQDQSVWYEYTPSVSGKYRFAVTNVVADSDTSFFRFGAALYTGSSHPLTLIGKSGADTGETSLSFRFDLTAGTSYKLKVYSPNAQVLFNDYNTIAFDVELEEIDTSGSPPANDDLADAEDLGINPEGVFSGSNIYATVEGWESAAGWSDPSVWYKFSIDSTFTQTVTLSKTGTDPDWQPYAEIYTVLNDPPSDFDDLDFYNYLGDDLFTGTEASTDVDWVSGNYVLYVVNWNSDGSWDDFDLNFQDFVAPPANDNFTNRTVLPKSYAVSVTGTTAGATVEGSEPNVNPGNLSPMPSVWYEWQAPNYINEPIDFQIDTLGSAAETYLEVFTGNSLFSPLTLIESDHNSGAGGKSQLTLNTGYNNYKIRVSSPVVNVGAIVLNITAQPGGSPPANDDFANAETLTGYDDSTSGTTVGATAEPEEQPWDYDDATTNTVWYKWTPPQTGRVRIGFEETGSNDGLFMTVLRGTTLNNLIKTDFFIDTFGGGENFDYLSVEGGIQYYFVVQGFGGAEDTFDLSLHMSTASPPANDDPANAQVISVSSLTGTINPVTEGANWDSVGPFQGDFVTDSTEEITVWYKFTPTRTGNVKFTMNSQTGYNADYTNDLTIRFYQGATPASLSTQISDDIRIPTENVTFNVESGLTYWVIAGTTFWVTASDISYSFTFQDDNTEGTFPDPSGGSTGDFDSTTGTFVADSADNEFVASGGVGYGTISPWTSPGTHYPYGWWTRFDIRSTSGDFLYRFGQTQQYIEIFRATKDGGDYQSIVILGHKEGYQSIGFSRNGGSISDTGYKVWGANTKGTTGKIRIECGENGLTIDGRCYLHNFDTLAIDVPTYFRDSVDDQFVTFDYGIRSYPGDGSAYVDLDPEWNFRYSNIAIHDNPETNVLGDADTSFNEVGLIEGWTTGQFLQRPGSSNQPSFMANDNEFPPNVIIAPAEYSNGFAIDCTVTGTTIPELSPRGAQWIGANQSLWGNRFCEPPADSYYPGISFGFYITDFPTSTSLIAYVYNQVGDGNHNGYELHVGNDGTLYIRPARDSALIPFCMTEENKWNYIELQGDFHTREYATKIWLDNFYMGRYKTTFVPATVNRVPLRPIQPNIYSVGRLSLSNPMGICFRDVAITRCKKDRPLGPTTIVSKKLNAVGTHNYTDPEEDNPPTAIDLAQNGDFSGGTDGAGQPHYWTGYDRHDSGRPAGAMYLGYLFQTFGDSLVDTVTDSSGPPGLEGATAMRITAVAQDGTGGDENYSQAAYVFGGGTEPATDVTFNYAYADTLSMQFWIKGIAGQKVNMAAESGIGGWDGWNSHTMSGDWEFVKLLLQPQSSLTGGHALTALTLGFPNSSPGDEFLVKDFHLYVNPDNFDASFWKTEDDGTTVERISAVADDNSYQLIDEFPPADGDDHVYLNTYDLKTGVKGKENDGKTHLPPMMSDAYLEYTLENVTIDADRPVYSAKILIGQKGFSGPSPDESVDWNNYVEGISHIMMANSNGERRDGGHYHSGIHISDEEPALFGFTLTRPPGDGPWTTEKWNNILIRLMTSEVLFTGNSLQIYSDYTNSAAIQGVWAEVLMYDRRLAPPNCIRPIDLSRIRFRSYQDGDA